MARAQLVTAGWVQVCHYMDPNADDAIEFYELQLALNRASQPDRSAEAEAQAASA